MIYTGQDVILGVVKKLNEEFEDEIPVYIDSVKSNLSYPCFVVVTVPTNHDKLPNNQTMDYIPLQVVYIKDGDNSDSYNLEFMNMTTRLNYTLDTIVLHDGHRISGTNMKSEIMQDTLYFSVDYRVLLYHVKDTPRMEKLEYKSEVNVE